VQRVDLNAVLRRAVEQGASDVHLKVGQFPVARCDGTLTPFADHPQLTDADLEAALAIVSELTPARRESFYETGELDIAYEDEVDSSIATLTSIIEPLMMIMVGAMVGVIVISMYLPMFKMLSLVK
jgi:Tfp pilus assembly ATPase PilU